MRVVYYALGGGHGHVVRGLAEAAIRSRAMAAEPEGRYPSVRELSADLARYLETGADPGWARRVTAEVHLWCGHPELALAQLAPDAEDFAHGDSDSAEQLSKAYRMTGQWDRARRTALAECDADEAYGLHLLALVVGAAEGVDAARPLWQRAARLTRTSGEPSSFHDHLHILVAAGLADWAALDARLGRCLAAADAPGTPWSDLADDLDALVRAPGADRARLGPRLARVIAARDAVRARYADLFSAPEPESAPAPLRPEAQE